MLKSYKFLILTILFSSTVAPLAAQERTTDMALAEACLTQRAEKVPKHRWSWTKYEYDIKVQDNNLSYHVILMSNDKDPRNVVDAVVVTNDEGYCDVPLINVSGLKLKDYEHALGKSAVQKLKQAYQSRR